MIVYHSGKTPTCTAFIVNLQVDQGCQVVILFLLIITILGCIAEKLNLRRFQFAALLMFLTKLLSIATFLACHHWAIRETVQV